MSKLLSVSQVAEQTLFCTETIYRLLQRGELRGRKVRGRWKVEEPAVREFLESGESPAEERAALAATLHNPRGRRPRGFIVVGNDTGSAIAWSLLFWVLVAWLGGAL